MGLLDPKPTPYDPVAWTRMPLPERAARVCDAWAMDGYGTPPAAYVVYAAKIGLYIAAWLGFCRLSPAIATEGLLGPAAFQKAVLWSMLFEGLGFGCGSGPLTGRYMPPVGGLLYWLRPGTTKLPLFRRGPLGGHTRTWLDVLIYGALVTALLFALVQPQHAPWMFAVVAGLTLLLGVVDRAPLLAFRPEHYLTLVLCFALAKSPEQWLLGAKLITLALWFWAGFSKLNHHFPAVVCVMTSNSPITRFRWMKKAVYRDYPADLRPSRLAVLMAHAGTAFELGVPLLYVFSANPTVLVVATVAMLLLHGYITSNIPMGVPLEWNFMVVYSAFALFWVHPGLAPLAISPAMAGVVFVTGCALPLLGNLFPSRISFLFAMRYYAGNWAYSVWLFEGDSHEKLEHLTKSAPWIYDQLAHFYDDGTARGLVGKVMGFRMMHLHGRALMTLLPKALPPGRALRDYEYLDGEIVAGLVLGWNFGDGHLHQERLLEAVQAQCGFEEGELRCIFVGSQPLGRMSLPWRIVDAKSGLLESGAESIASLRAQLPGTPPPGTP